MVNELSDEDKYKERVNELIKKDQLLPKQQDGLHKMIDSPDKENVFLAKEIISLNFINTLKIGLNVDQTNAFDAILTFLTKSNADAFVLKGYAGTGKTFLVKRILEYITSTYPNRSIAITAPTNKAVKVLQQDAPFDTEHSAGPIFKDLFNGENRLTYCTIHKLLGIKENLDYETGKQTFVADKYNKSDIKNYKYLIVDEVSQLDDVLCKDIMKHCKKIKIIFMGDPAQIPPIKRLDCIPFRKQVEFTFEQAELFEIMRQKGDHPIVDAAFLIRNNLTIAQPIPEIKTILNAAGNGIVYINAETERATIRPLLDAYFNCQAFMADSNYAKVICWKNNNTDYLNHIVREVLYGKNVNAYMLGEKLIANSPIFKESSDNHFNKNQWVIQMRTSEEMVITDIQVITKKYTEGRHTLYAKVYECTIDIYDFTKKGNIEKTIYIMHEDSAVEYKALKDSTLAMAKVVKNGLAWVSYYNILKWSADVCYNYAITAHKAQGSTYTNVILIEENIDLNKNVVERNRIKYTSYSRPTNKLYILRKNYVSTNKT